MNEETFNISIRKFLKMVGVSSQREIEQAVARAMSARTVTGNETLPASMTLVLPGALPSALTGLQLSVKFDGAIQLE